MGNSAVVEFVDQADDAASPSALKLSQSSFGYYSFYVRQAGTTQDGYNQVLEILCLACV